MSKFITKTVKRVMKLFNEEYHNKFDITESRKKFWENALADFDDEVILHAAYHLTTVSQSDWPPVIGQLRKQCVLMSLGQLQPPTGEEAWERVLEKVARKPVKLTDLEKKALAQTKTINDLRQSSNIEADRSRFMGALEKLVTKYIYDRQTLGEVKKFAASRVPQIEDGENTPKKIISHSEEQERVLVKDTNEPEYESPEIIKKLCQGVIRNIGKETSQK